MKKKAEILMKKPVYIGLSILEIMNMIDHCLIEKIKK